MSATSAVDYPTLGFDPCPGDTTEVSALAATMSRAATALDEIANVLHGAADGEWRGKAAIAFRDVLDDDLRPKIDRARDAFDDGHRHISSWSSDLADYQRRARRLESDAAAAQARADSAQSTLAGLPPAPGPGAAPAEDPAARRRLEDQAELRSSSQRKYDDAVGEVAGYRSQAEQLHTEYAELGRGVAKLLQHSIGIAPDEPGWFESVCDAIGDAFDAIGDLMADFGDWLLAQLHEFAPILKLIGDIAGVLSGILGLLAFIPGLQFLALPALILGGIALLGHYLAAAGTSGSFTEALTDPDVLMDAAGMVLGLGALKVGAKLLTAARASGNTRMVPQLVGPALEVPHGFFAIAKGTVTSMDTPEFLWRTATLKMNQAGFGLLGAGAPGAGEFFGKLFGWNWGPMTNEPAVVA